MAYIELHARSAFSFLRGASNRRNNWRRCRGSGRDSAAMALCDRNGVYGAPRFYAEAQEYKHGKESPAATD